MGRETRDTDWFRSSSRASGSFALRMGGVLGTVVMRTVKTVLNANTAADMRKAEVKEPPDAWVMRPAMGLPIKNPGACAELIRLKVYHKWAE